MTVLIRKAVFPVGGLGTRFLPATKAMPKEMLPVVDKPLIQYAVEEARAAESNTLFLSRDTAKPRLKTTSIPIRLWKNCWKRTAKRTCWLF